MNCLVTAGPTWEPLDAVRRLTNFSTGRLGTDLAAFLARSGHQVTLLRGETATHRAVPPGVTLESFSTTADLARRLAAHAGPTVEAVFHAAAVADFTPGGAFRRAPDGALTPLRAGKLDTRSGPLLVELRPTPKLIERLRDWFPAARLVGWKYEVDGDPDRVLARAREQLARCRTDLCVVNGPAWGDGFGVVTRDTVERLSDVSSLYPRLAER
jgi:phosphopantothenoylcysteine decarboxylase/phosphopantothenate--cysteine ligase